MSKGILEKVDASSVAMQSLMDGLKQSVEEQLKAKESRVRQQINALKLSQTESCNATESRLKLLMETNQEGVRIEFKRLNEAHMGICDAFGAHKARAPPLPCSASQLRSLTNPLSTFLFVGPSIRRTW